MLLSSACVYGLRASLYLASTQESSYISITRISEKLGISRHFLTKVLQQLTEPGLMESMKGPKGGVRLAHSPDNIKLIEIVAAIDGIGVFSECILGLPECGLAKPCPLHDQWANTREEIREMFENTTLAELAKRGKEGNLRITEEGKFRWE